MNNNFDLNISNYSIADLEEIFGLPHNSYDINTIQTKESKMKNNIMLDASITSQTKNNTLIFINDAIKELSNYCNSGFNNSNSNNNSNGNNLGNHSLSNLANTYANVYNLNTNLEQSNVEQAGGTYLIKRPNTPFGQSSPSEFYQGTINPLHKRILRQNLNIDTRFRDNYYSTQSSNFNVELPLRFTKVVSLQLSALELPTTFYAISKVLGNNFFLLSVPDQNINELITIPDGNYDYLSLQNYLNSAVSSFSNILSNVVFIVDLNTPEGKGKGGSGRMIVGINDSYSGPDFHFVLDFKTNKYGTEDTTTPLPLKFGWIIGYREGYYENNNNYVSEGIIDLNGPRYIYLVIDDFNNSVNNGFYAAFNSSFLNKNILARISLQGGIFNYLSENNLSLITSPRQYFGPVDIQKLNVQLLDEYGRVLNLNNMDYSFCLTLQTIYDL